MQLPSRLRIRGASGIGFLAIPIKPIAAGISGCQPLRGNTNVNNTIFNLAKRVLLLLALVGANAAWGGPTEAFWHDDAARGLSSEAPQLSEYRALTLDTAAVTSYLQAAYKNGSAVRIDLPQPDGGFAEFTLIDSGTLPADLQRKYPEIITLKGSDSQGRQVRVDVSPNGFNAMVFDPAGIWVIRPEVIGHGDHYLSFKRAGLSVPGGTGKCEVHEQDIDPAGLNLVPGAEPMTATGTTRRVYRTAIAANNRYIAAVGGGTVVGGLAATTMALNRVTQVYEYEMAIQLTLVPNNDLIMYPNAATDPFASNGTGVINNSTSVISAAVGASNYDIGHVFTTGSGGVAGLRVVCGGSKARGTTGLGNPTGDAFYIDFVAHEMGHQFGGNHPFNGSLGNCSGGNRNGSTAYEPGSGSTIQSYAGICSADDLQPHSDPFFHAISLQEITSFTENASTGGSCSANTPNTNNRPVIDPASLPAGYTIPARTPFVLSASATDPDAGDTPLYSWEEWDLGPQAPLSAGDNGTSPIFRSLPPTLVAERMFPKLSTVLGGAPIKGETLPTTNRTLKFRLTVRDNRAGQGTSDSKDVSIAVVNSAGPFKVTAPAVAVTWAAGTAQTVSWDVANTNVAPVSCSAVNIDLSSDGGLTFAHTLLTNAPNSGSASVTVPSLSTNQARVSVSCANNIFFNISPINFTVAPSGGTYSVGGTVSGLTGSGLSLKLNGGGDLAINANGAFTFPTTLLPGTAYAVTVGTSPSAPAQTCTVSNGSGTMPAANVTNVSVTCEGAAPTNYTVGGSVSGLTGSGLTLKLNGGASLPIAGNGAFVFPTALPNGSPYAVIVASQPTGPVQTCSVANGNGSIAGNVTNVMVTCVDGAPTSFTVGGTVVGMTGTGLKLRLNSGSNLLVPANGPFAFTTPMSNGDSYDVSITAQPTGQTCVVNNASGIIAGANVTDVVVDCNNVVTYTVGGSVSGLAGSGLALQLNGGSTLPISANGAFTFSGGLTAGTAYTVTIASQPTDPAQTCTIANGSGSIATANVSNVSVTCTTDVSDVIFANGFEAELTCAPLQLFKDPGFEASVDYENPFWTSTDSLGDTSFCDDGCDDGGTIVAHAGEWFVWFGGWEVANTATLSQSVTFPAGEARWMNYWMIDDMSGDATASLKLSIDGNQVLSFTPGSSEGWAPNSFQIPSQYLDGQAHTVKFDWSASAPGGDVGGAMFDDMTLDCTQGVTRSQPQPLLPRVASRKRH